MRLWFNRRRKPYSPPWMQMLHSSQIVRGWVADEGGFRTVITPLFDFYKTRDHRRQTFRRWLASESKLRWNSDT